MIETQRQEIKPLLSQLLQDGQTLLRQEVALARSEIREEGRELLKVAAAFGLAAGVGALAAILAALGVVSLLSWLAPSLPMWEDYLIVAALFAAISGSMLAKSRTAARALPGMPNTIQSMKENARWITAQAT